MDLIRCRNDDNDDGMTVRVETPEIERKRREAVWELFRSESVFLIDHLMVLKHVCTNCTLENSSAEVVNLFA